MPYLIGGLVLTPLIAAGLVALTKGQKSLGVIVRAAYAVLLVFALAVTFKGFEAPYEVDLTGFAAGGPLMVVAELGLAAYIIFLGLRRRSYVVVGFSVLQIALLLWYEFGASHNRTETETTLLLDHFALLMILIIAVVGGLICVYTIEYMKDYHHHHTEVQDRRRFFLIVLLVFMSTMFLLVMCNDLVYMLFFWEITSFCSYLLIGYTKAEQATKNAMRALTINVGGGVAFLAGIVLLVSQHGVTDILSLCALGKQAPFVDMIVFLLAVGGLTKAAQLPFSSWLVGAMVAPTPSSAMLHSSTMVKAGVYLIIRLMPLMGDNVSGTIVTMIGGVTFLAGAFFAVAQEDGKKILAYSTISNLGLIVACAGIGTGESMWAAIMLIVFHAVAKSLLFLTVGSTEHQIGSRGVEQMDGLYNVSHNLAILLIIGIAGMFLAPFGMLISKWAAMKAFIDSGRVLIVLMVAFGSSVTLFFWAKWMGRLIANTNRTHVEPYVMRMDEKVSLYSLAALVVAVCLFHPALSEAFIIPYVDMDLHISLSSPIDPFATTLILAMLSLLFILPLLMGPLFRRQHLKQSHIYMGGQNTGDDESYYGSMGQIRSVELRNWYMKKQFGGRGLALFSVWTGGVLLVAGFLLIAFGMVG